MPVGWAAAAAAVGSVASGYMQGRAARDAARTQQEGAAYAADVQRDMFDVSRAQQQPFMESGYGANAELSRLMGIAPQTARGNSPGSEMPEDLIRSNGGVPAMNEDLYASDPGYRQAWDQMMESERANPRWKDHSQTSFYTAGNDADFARIQGLLTQNMTAYREAHPDETTATPGAGGSGMPDEGGTGLPTGYLTQLFTPEAFKAGIDPGYQWRAQQGAQGVMNTAAAGSGSLSGPALKALMEYNQGAASQEYGAAFNRFQTQQGNIFQRLTSMAGMGQNAAAGVGNQAVATGGNIGANIVGGANAAAAGQVGAANAYGGALSDLGGIAAWYGMNRQQQVPGG
jgi:hypothetical protein